MFIGIWGFNTIRQILAQLRYKNRLLDELNINKKMLHLDTNNTKKIIISFWKIKKTPGAFFTFN
jgi:hypothetical protein